MPVGPLPSPTWLPGASQLAVPCKALFINNHEVEKSNPKKPGWVHFVSVHALQSDDVNRSWDGGTYRIWWVFLGDDGGCSASSSLLELGHFQSNRNKGGQHDLGVLIDFGDIFLIAVNVQSNGGPCTPSAT